MFLRVTSTTRQVVHQHFLPTFQVIVHVNFPGQELIFPIIPTPHECTIIFYLRSPNQRATDAFVLCLIEFHTVQIKV